MIVFPNCKINLGLHIIRKRPDAFHDIETVFYPIPLTDALEMVQNPGQVDFQFSTSGLPLDTNSGDNICSKAYLLLKNDYPNLPPVNMHLHKKIPAGAGLGGGSSDGAFTLLLLNRKFNLGLTTDQLISYALRLGSDCPFFILNRPCIASGRGEQMEDLELDLSVYTLVLINPGIHVNTGWAFSQISPDSNRPSLKEIIASPVESWKDILMNDFEKPVFENYPEISNIKKELYRAGALYASMSGSGSSVYGIFRKNVNPSLDIPAGYFIQYF